MTVRHESRGGVLELLKRRLKCKKANLSACLFSGQLTLPDFAIEVSSLTRSGVKPSIINLPLTG